MGVKVLFASQIGGGGHFLHALHITNWLYMATNIHQLRHRSGVLSRSITANFQPEGGKNGSKVNFFLLVFVLPRDFRRQQTAKSKHIFEIEEGKRGVEVVGCLPFGVPTCTGFRGLRTCRRLALVLSWCRLSRVQDLRSAGSGPLVVCSVAFVLFLALLLVRWL